MASTNARNIRIFFQRRMGIIIFRCTCYSNYRNMWPLPPVCTRPKPFRCFCRHDRAAAVGIFRLLPFPFIALPDGPAAKAARPPAGFPFSNQF